MTKSSSSQPNMRIEKFIQAGNWRLTPWKRTLRLRIKEATHLKNSHPSSRKKYILNYLSDYIISTIFLSSQASRLAIEIECNMNIHYSVCLIYGFSVWLLIFSGRKETSKVWKSVKLLLSLKAWAIKCFRNKLPIEGDMGAITRFCYSYQASSNIYYFSPTFNPHLLHKWHSFE